MFKNKKKDLLLLATIAFFVCLYAFIPPVWKLRGDILISRRDENGISFTTTLGHRSENWTKADKIPSHVANSFVVSEDLEFYNHFGISFLNIRRSLDDWYYRGKKLRGGSTITQQVIKVAFLHSQRSYWRKAREIAGSILAELLFTKKEILTWYLNLAELGPGIYGIDQGAKHYFKKPASDLAIWEAANLAIILPNPKDWSQSLREQKLTPFAQGQVKTILMRLLNFRYITNAEMLDAFSKVDFGHSHPQFENLLSENQNQDGNGFNSSSKDIPSPVQLGCENEFFTITIEQPNVALWSEKLGTNQPCPKSPNISQIDRATLFSACMGTKLIALLLVPGVEYLGDEDSRSIWLGFLNPQAHIQELFAATGIIPEVCQSLANSMNTSQIRIFNVGKVNGVGVEN